MRRAAARRHLLTVSKRSSRVDNFRSGFWSFSLSKLDVQVIEMSTLRYPRLKYGHECNAFTDNASIRAI